MKLCLFYKVFKNEYLQYLFHLIPVRHSSQTSRNVYSIPIFSLKHGFFKNSFFPSTISEWNKLDPVIRNSESLSIFRKNILYFIRPAPNSVYNCHNLKGVKLITRLQLGLSHLTEHKFKHSFQDSINSHAFVVVILNLQLISFFTVPYLLMKHGAHSKFFFKFQDFPGHSRTFSVDFPGQSS